MTTLDFITEDAAITFYNSEWGKETITFNGKVVSEKISLCGTRHEFTIDNENYEVITSLVFNSIIGLKTQLRKNGRLVDEKTSGQSTLHMLIGLVVMVLLIEFTRRLF